jgi:hypothetical protein
VSKEKDLETIPPFAQEAPTQVMPELSAAHDSKWISCKQAGKMLNLSERRVQELANVGLLESARAKDPKRGNQWVTVILRASVLRYKEEKRNPPPSPVVPRSLPAPRAPLQLPAPADTVHLNSIPTPWCTLAEAADFTGLPASKLLDLYKGGKLAALDCGPRPGGSLRFKRSDLEKIEGDLQKAVR